MPRSRHEIERMQAEVRMLTQRVESLEHVIHTALNRMNTLSLKVQYLLIQRQQEEKEQEE